MIDSICASDSVEPRGNLPTTTALQSRRHTGRPAAYVVGVTAAALLLATPVLADMPVVEMVPIGRQAPRAPRATRPARPAPTERPMRPGRPPRAPADVAAPPPEPSEPVTELPTGVAPEAPPTDAPGGALHFASCAFLRIHAYTVIHVLVSDIEVVCGVVKDSHGNRRHGTTGWTRGQYCGIRIIAYVIQKSTWTVAAALDWLTVGGCGVMHVNGTGGICTIWRVLEAHKRTCSYHARDHMKATR